MQVRVQHNSKLQYLAFVASRQVLIYFFQLSLHVVSVNSSFESDLFHLVS
jgi:hypothetical protein